MITGNAIEGENVIRYFEEISKIPRNSGNERGMRDYLVNFAESRNLSYYTDEYNNVIIYKKTCNKDPIILQAHTDMVCVARHKCSHDFNRDSISVIRKNGWLMAKNTTLGADDGIGVALILDVLDGVADCNIEAVFSSSEETTMQGAYKINTKKLSAKKMICLDGFEEDTIITSSASFTDFYVTTNNNKSFVQNVENLKTFKLTLSGLEGGHSGFDIDKNRGNSNKLITELLFLLKDITLNDFCGGHNYNVIPSKTEVVFSTTLNDKIIKSTIKTFYNEKKKIYKGLKIACNRQLNKTLVLDDGANLLGFINDFTNGVIKKDEKGNVTASQNLSEISTENGYIKIGLRSNAKNYDKEMIQNLKALCNKYNFMGKAIDTQPSFNTFENSVLLQKLKEANPNASEVKHHIAVECGIFQDRVKNLDVVIIAPTIKDAHSVTERVSVDSIGKTSSWLKKFLEIY